MTLFIIKKHFHFLLIKIKKRLLSSFTFTYILLKLNSVIKTYIKLNINEVPFKNFVFLFFQQYHFYGKNGTYKLSVAISMEIYSLALSPSKLKYN